VTEARELCFRFAETDSHILFPPSIELGSFSEASNCIFIFDGNTYRLFADQMTRHHCEKTSVVLASGEKSKNWRGAEKVLLRAIEAGLGRDGMFIAVGGGMVCDLAAFSASIYMRGCRLALVPTSLLAMVDAAIGGKTAINLGGYKNMAGTFYPAGEIYICTELLKSLPEREFRSGLAETIKTALLGDERLFEILARESDRVLARDPAFMEEMVRRCIAVKGVIVEKDLREQGKREVLNLGHSFGHALEAVTELEGYSHGEAIAWGLLRAAKLSRKLGLADAVYESRVQKILETYHLPLEAEKSVKAEAVVSAMQADKKKRKGKLRLVLQRRIGDTVVREVEEQLIVEALQDSSRISE